MQQRINPALCLHDQDSTIIDNLNETKKILADFDQQHQISLSMRNTQNPDSIQALCQQTKNDAQINESIQNTIDKLLSSLSKNLQPQETTSG
jgi:predicted RNA-binding protein with RPS1 domain